MPVAAPATATSIPAAPTPPRNIPFGDRVAGRHLLYDARDAYQNSPAVTFTARWTLVNAGAPGVGNAATYRGTESVSAQVAQRRFALSTETITPGGDRTLRRALTDGRQITSTLFQENKAAKTPTREVVRLPMDEGVTVSRALRQVQVSPTTRAATLLLDPNVGSHGDATLWRSGTTTIGGVRADIVDEVEAPVLAGRNRSQRTRRYVFAPSNHRLLRYEEWMTTSNEARARPARGNRPADDGTRMTYRREDYTGVNLGAGPLAAATFAQAVPSSYTEKAPPTVELPPLEEPSAPDAYAPQALTLLSRWRNAFDRAYTLSADVAVSLRGTQETGDPDSVALPSALRSIRQNYQVTLRKPDQARVLLNTTRAASPTASAGIGRQRGMGFGVPDTLLAVSDGQQVRVIEDKTQARTVPLVRDDALYFALNRAGLRDRFGALLYVFTPPPRATDWDQISYNGPATLENGEAVEVFTLQRGTTEVARRRRRFQQQQPQEIETLTYVRVSLGRDGLPRLIETQRVSTLASGAIDWNSPPPFVVASRLQRVTADAEPNPDAFALPPAPAGSAGR